MGHDLRGPVGRLVPGQHRSGDAQAQYQKEQDHPDYPVELPWFLVRTTHKGADHVQSDDEEQHVGTPQVHTPHDRCEFIVVLDVVEALPRLRRRGDVGPQQEHAGDDLKDDDDQGGAA